MSEERLARIEAKLDDTNEHLGSIDVSLAEMRVDVAYHIKRSDSLEEQVVPLSNLRKEMKGVIKLIYLISALAAIVEAIRALK